jgi:large subunit ribosomal protein L32e
MVTPSVRVKKVKKHRREFLRSEADRYKRVGTKKSWRHPHGIDNKVRRKILGANCRPGVGYGTAKVAKFLLPNGFRKFIVKNEKDLECLLMHNRTYSAEFAHSLSGSTRKKLVIRARELNVRVTNGQARLRTEEHE